jgi:hypothetical protein
MGCRHGGRNSGGTSPEGLPDAGAFLGTDPVRSLKSFPPDTVVINAVAQLRFSGQTGRILWKNRGC